MMLALALAPLLFTAVDPEPAVTATAPEYALPDSVLLEPGSQLAHPSFAPHPVASTPEPAPAARPNFGLNLMLGGGVLGAATIGLGLGYLLAGSGDSTATCRSAGSFATCEAQHENQEEQQILAGTMLLSVGSLAMTAMILVGAMNQATDAASAASAPTHRSVPLSLAPMVVHDGGGLALQGTF